ncbi:MAG: transposase [Bullifex sp.]|nr:transposase [Bullifex sp.]
MVDDNGNDFAGLYNAGQLASKEALNPASHMAGSCSMTTDGTSVYDQLASATGSFQRKTEDRKDSKAEVNLNRINSFHSVIKSYYRNYRGVASKYINRYASMFAYAWNVNKFVKEGEKYEHTLSTVRKDGISLNGEELRDYRLYAPDDLVYRAA